MVSRHQSRGTPESQHHCASFSGLQLEGYTHGALSQAPFTLACSLPRWGEKAFSFHLGMAQLGSVLGTGGSLTPSAVTPAHPKSYLLSTFVSDATCNDLGQQVT